MNATLLEAVLRNPDDDEPRLVYADACEEAGDLDRARFIRLQIRQAEMSRFDPARFDLAHEIRMLEAAHRPRWLAELPSPPGVAYGRFRRGFVDTVCTKVAARLADALADVERSIPLRRWISRAGTPAALALDGSPLGIREIVVESTRLPGQPPFDLEALWTLLERPVASRLDGLRLPFTPVADEVRYAERLAAWGCRVRTLHLGCDHLSPEAMSALVEAPGLASVEDLSLASRNLPTSVHSIAPEAMRALLRRCRGLRALDVGVGALERASCQVVFDEGPVTLAHLGTNSLVGVDPTNASFALETLCGGPVRGPLDAPCFARLRGLRLSGGEQRLSTLPDTLRELWVSRAGRNPVRGPHQLEVLEVLDSPGLVPLVAESAPTLRMLRLLHTDVPDPPSLPALIALRAHDCDGASGLVARSPRLRSLDLTGVTVDAELRRWLPARALVDADLPYLPVPLPTTWNLVTLGASGEAAAMLPSLPDRLPLLQELRVYETNDDGDALLEWIPEGAPHLLRMWLRLGFSDAVIEKWRTSQWAGRLYAASVAHGRRYLSIHDRLLAGELSELDPIGSDLPW
ncbi:MAG: TIGR02996 domain-containing protein [Myxococcota bacterium]